MSKHWELWVSDKATNFDCVAEGLDDEELDQDELHDEVMDVLQSGYMDDLPHNADQHIWVNEATGRLMKSGAGTFPNGVKLELRWVES